jgi:phospholipase A1
LGTARDDMTIGELRRFCQGQLLPAEVAPPEEPPGQQNKILQQNTPSTIEKKLAEEAKTGDLLYTLTPHRRNYLMPIAYNSSPNKSVYKGTAEEDFNPDNFEAKFQVSLKYKLIDDLFDKDLDFYLAYTNLSYWQAYSSNPSSVLRDTNHEPEAWLQFNTNWELLGIKSRIIRVGAWHQSNGKGEPFSRSWNRLYANFIFEKDNLVFEIKPWYRLPEDHEDDDNPDIKKYYGHGELSGLYKWNEHNLSFMLRNNLRSSENKGAIELGWTFPLYNKIKGYLQYFNGYGQSILDYDSSANTIGIGIALTDLY